MAGRQAGRRKLPGREGKVYLRPVVNGALEAYREGVQDRTGVLPAVNAILLELVEVFLVEEGHLPPSMLGHRKMVSVKGDDNGTATSER